jgi:hypothetical protein
MKIGTVNVKRMEELNSVSGMLLGFMREEKPKTITSFLCEDCSDFPAKGKEIAEWFADRNNPLGKQLSIVNGNGIIHVFDGEEELLTIIANGKEIVCLECVSQDQLVTSW